MSSYTTVNALYTHALRQSTSLQADLTALEQAYTSANSFNTASLNGQINASFAAFDRTVDDYDAMARREIVEAKREKAVTYVRFPWTEVQRRIGAEVWCGSVLLLCGGGCFETAAGAARGHVVWRRAGRKASRAGRWTGVTVEGAHCDTSSGRSGCDPSRATQNQDRSADPRPHPPS
jgi:hypothetical protein